jgi:hypothetical protein
MEAVSYLMGLKHGDEPCCVSPAIACFIRRWNDTLSDEDRNTILKPILPSLVGTNEDGWDGLKNDCRRRLMGVDWVLKTCLPDLLKLTPALYKYGVGIGGGPVVSDIKDLDGIEDLVVEAQAAAAEIVEKTHTFRVEPFYNVDRFVGGSGADPACHMAMPLGIRPVFRLQALAGDAVYAALAVVGEDVLSRTVSGLQRSAYNLVADMVRVGKE